MTEEAFICDYVRTPIGRYGGALAGVRADDLAAHPIRELLRRHRGMEHGIDEVFLGSANQAGEDNRNLARMALLLAGLPEFDSRRHRQPALRLGHGRGCGGGAGDQGGRDRACVGWRLGIDDARAARDGQGRERLPALGRGVRFDHRLALRQPPDESPLWGRFDAETAQNVADQHEISRADQDAFALRSLGRTAAAQAKGTFDAEILSVEIEGPQGRRLSASRRTSIRAPIRASRR